MILDHSPPSLRLAASHLRQGELVAIPTETVYGLAADARNPEAVAQIFEVKNRPSNNPLIVHCCKIAQVENMIDFDSMNDTIRELFSALTKRFWPGPLTIVVPATEEVPDIVSAGQRTVALRMPNHEITLALLELADVAVAAPSANPHLYVSPTTAAHVESQIGSQIAAVLDGGACTVGVESTILSLTEKTPKILRHGGVSIEELDKFIPNLQSAAKFRDLQETEALPSPGQFKKHYSPRTKTTLAGTTPTDPQLAKNRALLLFKPTEKHVRPAASHVEVLSDSGDLREVARNLYATLRRVDEMGFQEIVVDTCDEEGIGRAIMDRVRRASS